MRLDRGIAPAAVTRDPPLNVRTPAVRHRWTCGVAISNGHIALGRDLSAWSRQPRIDVRRRDGDHEPCTAHQTRAANHPYGWSCGVPRERSGGPWVREGQAVSFAMAEGFVSGECVSSPPAVPELRAMAPRRLLRGENPNRSRGSTDGWCHHGRRIPCGPCVARCRRPNVRRSELDPAISGLHPDRGEQIRWANGSAGLHCHSTTGPTLGRRGRSADRTYPELQLSGRCPRHARQLRRQPRRSSGR